MDVVLEVKVREGRGTRDAKRLRREGRVPAVLYGHGEDTVSLSVSSERLDTVLRHGARVIDLTGAVSQTALIRDVQWDTYGIDIADGQDDVLYLASAVVIDLVCHGDNKD